MPIKLIILLAFSSSIFANREYTVGVEAIPFLPYSQVNQTKQYSGYFKDILNKFGSQEGIKFNFVPLPINRLYTDFYNKKLDFKLPSNPYWQANIKTERKLKITYSGPILSYIDGVISAKDLKEIKDLKKLGIISGFTPWGYEEFISNKSIALKENPNVTGLLKQTALKRIDGAYTNIAVTMNVINQMPSLKGKIKFARDVPFIKSDYHLSTIKHKEIIKKFNLFLSKEKAYLDLIRKDIDQYYK